VLNIVLDTVRERGQIAIAVASSGVAALLLHGGRTAHSRFKIPMDNMNETSTCTINAQSGLARLIVRTSLIIWDEASMLSKHQISCVDRTIRDLMPLGSANSKRPFGGIIVVFSGESAGPPSGSANCVFRRLSTSVASRSARRKSENSRADNETMG
jgi:ATP-dependent DNA helicase PIF1